MKILLTGGTGLLGKSIIDTNKDNEIISISNDDNDLLSKINVNTEYINADILNVDRCLDIAKSFKPNYLIHCASIGSPDFAEKNKEITWNTNVNGTAKMVDICNCVGSKMIYISSNGIYDGLSAPYSETDKPIPLNYYGETKLKAEEITKECKNGCTIVRPILMYGWNSSLSRKNIVTMALDKLNKNENIFVYNDVYSNPLYSIQCAQAIWKIIENGYEGIFNIAGKERTTIYGLIKKVAEVFEKDKNLVKPVKQGYFSELVSRPIDTSFNTDKMVNQLGITPLTLEEGLTLMKNSMEVEKYK